MSNHIEWMARFLACGLCITVRLCWWILQVMAGRFMIKIMPPTCRYGLNMSRSLFLASIGSCLVYYWGTAFNELSNFTGAWVVRYMTSIYNLWLRTGPECIMSRAIKEWGNSLHRLGIWFVRWKWMMEPQDCKYGCEYAMVCEPRAIGKHDFYRDH